MRVLLTGDADDGFAEPRADGRWGWRADLVAGLLTQTPDRLLFFAGCSEEQAELPFDYRVLLTAPRAVLISDCARVPATRTGVTTTSLPRYSRTSTRSSRFCVARLTSS